MSSMLLLLWSAVATANGPISRPLPQIVRSGELARIRASSPKIERHRQRYLQKEAAGTLDQVSPAKQRTELKIKQGAERLNQALRQSSDKRPILVLVEGSDGVGKSSTIRRLVPGFEGARKVDVVHFGAPAPGDNDVHWIKRFFDQLPAEGQVKILDRSYYGRAVYEVYHGLIDKRTAKQSIKEIRAFEKLLARRVRIVKFFLDASGDRQAQTIAKREVVAPEKLSESDYTTYRDRKQIKRMFRHVIERTGKTVPWHVVPMNDRGAGRLQLFETLKRELGD